MTGGVHLFSNNTLGQVLLEGKQFSYSGGVSGRSTVSCHSCHGKHKLFQHGTILLKRLPVYKSRRILFACTASSNSHKRNPDFSRQNKGFSRGRNRQNQERDHTENIEETDLLSSKNGPLLSLSSNPRYQATATPGQREKEIVELFRKVQAQLRERAAIKEEKKIEASQGQGESGTVDSLLKLLRKHSGDQGKRSGGEEEFNLDPPGSVDPFEDDQSSNFFEPNNIASEKVQEAGPVPSTRPASNFRRKSPVPRVKYQPVYSAEESISSGPSLQSVGKQKKTSGFEPDPEPVSLDGRDELLDDEPSEPSDNDETEEDTSEPSSANENMDLNSLKLSELRALAKSQGLKGYSKMKKGDLVELLSTQ